jgi:hypothetical protein
MKKIYEAKDERPGMRFKQAQEGGAPRGMSSSPIGREDFNPEKYKPRTGDPKDRRSTGVSETKKTLMFALDLVARDPKYRNQFNSVIVPHFQLANDLRVSIKRLQGTIQELDKLEKTKARMYKEKSPDLDKLEKIESRISELTDTVADYEVEIKQLDDEIDQNISNRESVNELSEIIKAAARSLSDSMTDEDKQRLASNTFKNLADLNLNIVGDDPELRLFLREVIIKPEKFDPLTKFYDLVTGQRDDAKERGAGYYFINPLFSIGTIFKNALDRSLREPKKPIGSSHTLRQAAKQTIGTGLSGIIDRIKKGSTRKIMSMVYDYDNLDDREKKIVDTELNSLKDDIRGYAAGLNIDQSKINNVTRLIDDLKTGDATEANVVTAIYTIKEGFVFKYDTIIERLLVKYK